MFSGLKIDFEASLIPEDNIESRYWYQISNQPLYHCFRQEMGHELHKDIKFQTYKKCKDSNSGQA